jgi:hypothetical protein
MPLVFEVARVSRSYDIIYAIAVLARLKYGQGTYGTYIVNTVNPLLAGVGVG